MMSRELSLNITLDKDFYVSMENNLTNYLYEYIIENLEDTPFGDKIVERVTATILENALKDKEIVETIKEQICERVIDNLEFNGFLPKLQEDITNKLAGILAKKYIIQIDKKEK